MSPLKEGMNNRIYRFIKINSVGHFGFIDSSIKFTRYKTFQEISGGDRIIINNSKLYIQRLNFASGLGLNEWCVIDFSTQPTSPCYFDFEMDVIAASNYFMKLTNIEHVE